MLVGWRTFRHTGPVPTYEWRCKACGSTFELKRSMDRSAEPATCPDGHSDTVKLLSTVALGGAPAAAAAQPTAGGCCGGGCCG